MGEEWNSRRGLEFVGWKRGKYRDMKRIKFLDYLLSSTIAGVGILLHIPLRLCPVVFFNESWGGAFLSAIGPAFPPLSFTLPSSFLSSLTKAARRRGVGIGVASFVGGWGCFFTGFYLNLLIYIFPIMSWCLYWAGAASDWTIFLHSRFLRVSRICILCSKTYASNCFRLVCSSLRLLFVIMIRKIAFMGTNWS